MAVESLLSFAAALLGIGATLWLAAKEYRETERAKKEERAYVRRERRYAGLLKSLPGFFVNSTNRAATDEFIREYNLAWLYCPDDVVRACNSFLLAASGRHPMTDDERKATLANLVVTMRRDLRGESGLTADEFEVWISRS